VVSNIDTLKPILDKGYLHNSSFLAGETGLSHPESMQRMQETFVEFSVANHD